MCLTHSALPSRGIHSCTPFSLEVPLRVICVTSQHESARGTYDGIGIANTT